MAPGSPWWAMLRRLCLVLVLAIGGCTDNPYRLPNRQEVKGEGMSLVVTHARDEAEGRPLADEYCRARGGIAHFKGMMQYRTKRELSHVASFDCLTDTAHGMGLNTQTPAGSGAAARTAR